MGRGVGADHLHEGFLEAALDAGVDDFLAQLPILLFMLIGGVIADRLGRARVIAVTDIVLSAFVMTTAVLFLTGTATVPLLIGLSFVSGVLNGLWWPAFPGLVPDVIKDEGLLQPANAYVSVGSNAGLIVGNTTITSNAARIPVTEVDQGSDTTRPTATQSAKSSQRSRSRSLSVNVGEIAEAMSYDRLPVKTHVAAASIDMP